jgi:hypothetical protein
MAKAERICASSRSPTLTPRPWFPFSGFSTTGSPMSCAAAHASSALRTVRPSGTGTPTERRIPLVSGFS